MSRILHRSQFATPPIAVSGKGMYLVGADGRQIIDGSGGAAVACLGHGDARVNEAIKAQLDQVAYVHTALFTNQAAEDLADMILDDFHHASATEALERLRRRMPPAALSYIEGISEFLPDLVRKRKQVILRAPDPAKRLQRHPRFIVVSL